MKLSDELNSRIKNAKSDAEVKSILAGVRNDTEKAGIILNDEELEAVSGGFNWRNFDWHVTLTKDIQYYFENGNPAGIIPAGRIIEVIRKAGDNWYEIIVCSLDNPDFHDPGFGFDIYIKSVDNL